jgi:hypothetical protein
METKETVRHELEKALGELETLRDDIRVRAHLAGMEAKDKWAELEPKLAQVETQLKEATKTFRQALAELGDAVKALRKPPP